MAGFYKEFMAALHAGLEEEMAKNAAVLAFSYIGRCALSIVLLTIFLLSHSYDVLGPIADTLSPPKPAHKNSK